MLGPVNKIARGGNADGVGLAVPLGIGEDIGATLALDKARIFNTPWPFAILLGVLGRVEDWCIAAGEVNAIG